MNIWSILGILPTDDIKEIKSAYSALLKQYHPEEYPEKFNQIQTAYTTAIKYAKDSKKQQKPPPNIIDTDDEFAEFSSLNDAKEDGKQKNSSQSFDIAFNAREKTTEEDVGNNKTYIQPEDLQTAFNNREEEQEQTDEKEFDKEFDEILNNETSLDDIAQQFMAELNKLPVMFTGTGLRTKQKIYRAWEEYFTSEDFYKYTDYPWFQAVFLKYLQRLVYIGKDTYVIFKRELISHLHNMPHMIADNIKEIFKNNPNLENWVKIANKNANKRPQSKGRTIGQILCSVMLIAIFAIGFYFQYQEDMKDNSDIDPEALQNLLEQYNQQENITENLDIDTEAIQNLLEQYNTTEEDQTFNNFEDYHPDVKAYAQQLLEFYENRYGMGSVIVAYHKDVGIFDDDVDKTYLYHEYEVILSLENSNGALLNYKFMQHVPVDEIEEIAEKFVLKDEFMRGVLRELTISASEIDDEAVYLPYELDVIEKSNLEEHAIIICVEINLQDDTMVYDTEKIISALETLNSSIWQDERVSQLEVAHIYILPYAPVRTDGQPLIVSDVSIQFPIYYDEEIGAEFIREALNTSEWWKIELG